MPDAHTSDGTEIPAIIHQIALGAQPSGDIQQNIDRLKTANPQWEHRLYDDGKAEDFIRTAFGADILRSYQRIDHRYAAARADLLRYLLMFRSGGVYLDLKSSFSCPIDERIDRKADAFIVSQWSNGCGERFEGYGLKEQLYGYPGGEFQQWHIIACPGHPFLKAVIEAVLRLISGYRPWREGTGKVGVMNVTGPVPYTMTLAPMLDSYPHRRLRREEEVGLIYSIFQGDAHHALHGRYYSELRHPVVRPMAGQRLPVGLYMAARTLRDRVSG